MRGIPFGDVVSNFHRYGRESSTHDLVKALAIAIMIVDHLGYFFFPGALWWRAIGRIGFPVWFFMAGYAKPSRPSSRLLDLALLMAVADRLAGQDLLPINALLGIYLCRWFVSSKLVSAPLTAFNWLLTMMIVLVTAPLTFLLFEYGFQGVLFAVAGSYCRLQREHPLTKATLGLSFAVFIAVQLGIFHFSPWQQAVMIGGTAGMCVYLYRFRLAWPALPAPLRPLRPAINFLSRNSHYVYAVHFIAFLAIAVIYFNPDGTRRF